MIDHSRSMKSMTMLSTSILLKCCGEPTEGDPHILDIKIYDWSENLIQFLPQSECAIFVRI